MTVDVAVVDLGGPAGKNFDNVSRVPCLEVVEAAPMRNEFGRNT